MLGDEIVSPCGKITGSDEYKYKYIQKKAYGGSDLCQVSASDITQEDCEKYCSNTDGCTHYQFGKRTADEKDWSSCNVGVPCCYLKSDYNHEEKLADSDNYVIGIKSSGDDGGGLSGLAIFFIVLAFVVLTAIAIFFVYKYTKKDNSPSSSSGGFPTTYY